MILKVKILRGKECTIEANGTSSVSFIKQLVARELDIPVDQQRLVFKGKTLSDGLSLGDYNIVDGTKLYLLVRKAEADENGESLQLWTELDQTLQKHFTKEDANRVLNEMKMNLSAVINDLSLDDIERYSKSMTTAWNTGQHQQQSRSQPTSSSSTNCHS